MNHRQQLREQSFKSLSHPLAVGAIILLLLNDHWLRWNYPSWWTGKIGDVAWLIFAPFLLTFMLSYLLPKNKLRYSVAIAFIGVGLVFGLGNTVPIFHNFIVSTFQMVAGWQPQMYLDPTDLLTLPALLIGWKIWQVNETSQRPRPFYKHTIGWLMLSIGALGTMGSSPSYHDYGVYCVMQQEEKLLAGTVMHGAAGNFYESLDSGVTWNIILMTVPEMTIQSCGKENIPWEIKTPSNEDIHWRIKEDGISIEQSYDAGETWTTVYKFPAGKQVREYYYRPHRPFMTARIISPGGPYNGTVDEVTGNLIVAMGFEGVIIITPEGEVSHADVGSYTFVDIHEISLFNRLSNELFLAIWLACLSIAILSIPTWPVGWKIVVITSTLFWVILSLFGRESGLILFIYDIGQVRFIYPILAVIGGIGLARHHSWRTICFILGATIISVTLFMIPLLFWTTGIMPSYQFAMAISVFMAFMPIGYGFQHINKLAD